MRVIAGKYKGKKLFSVNSSSLKPSSGFLKETLFNIINHHYKNFLVEQHFLEIFAGTGAIALEAYSRGAKSITLVEKQQDHCNVIKKNLINIEHQLICNNFLTIAATVFKEPFSLVYLDPPYNLNLLPKALAHLLQLNILSSQALIITESKINTFKLSDLNNYLENNLLNSLSLEITKTIGIKELYFLKYQQN